MIDSIVLLLLNYDYFNRIIFGKNNPIKILLWKNTGKDIY